MYTIMVIDDDESIGNMEQELLEREGYQVQRAFSGTEALLLLKQKRPNLILLDLMLPGMSGEKVLSQIQGIPIIVVSAKTDADSKVNLLLGGAVDYLTKPFSYNELNVRVKALLRRYHVYQGKKEEAKAIIRLNDLEIDQEHKEVYLNKNKLSLTDIEYEILDYLILNRKQVISASQLFETIWHENYYYGANNTIMVHIRNLRKKIEEDPQNPRIIKTVWGKGYYID